MASPVDTSVRYFTDEMAGIPQLSGTAGALIAIFDACLVNGFGTKSVTSLTVTGGVATLTFSGGASAALPQSVILVEGVTGGMLDLNGEQKVLSVSTTEVTFATALGNGTASGTISFKMAPLGWTKVYSGTNKAVYKPSAIAATSALLRVDDTGTTTARMRMYESMTDIDTGTNPTPTDAKVSGGFHWWKSSVANATAVDFTIVGDERFVYCAPSPYATTTSMPAIVHAFGDLDSYKSGDAYCGVLFGESAITSSSSNGSASAAATNLNCQIMRSRSGLGSSVNCDRRSLVGASGVSGDESSGLGPFPSPANNGLFLSRMFVAENPFGTNGIRGLLPGLLYVPQTGTNGGVFPRGTLVDGTGAFAGKKIYAVPQAASGISISTNDYTVFFDVTGPWRS